MEFERGHQQQECQPIDLYSVVFTAWLMADVCEWIVLSWYEQ